MEDRYQRLVRSEAEKQQEELIARLKQQLQQQQPPQPPTPEPAQAPASPGGSARGKPRPPSSKAAAEAKKAAEEAEAARKAWEEAAKARAEAEAALAEAEARVARSPLSRSGVPLCRTLNLPEDVLRRTIESIQVGLLGFVATTLSLEVWRARQMLCTGLGCIEAWTFVRSERWMRCCPSNPPINDALPSPLPHAHHRTPPTTAAAPPRPAPHSHPPQSGLLSDMMTFCQRTLEAAEGWAGEREVALTEELDSWLRHHR